MFNLHPLVTIRVPAYNHADYIEELLESILFDDYPNKELVIIDDGSTDDTAVIIKHWIEKNNSKIPVKFRSRENRGLTITINELLEMSNGEFIVGIASDDVLISGGIRQRVDFLLKHTKKEAVFGDCQVIDENGSLLFDSGLSDLYHAKKNNLLSDNCLQKEIILNWSIPGPVLMVRKCIYQHIGFYDEQLAVEDWDLYLRMVAQNKLGFLNTPVAKYRLHGKNVATTQLLKVINNRITTAWKNIGLFSYPNNIYVLVEIGYLYLLKVYRAIR